MEISRTALRKLMLLITFAILLYTGLQHLSQVLGFFRFVGGVVSPLLIGGATAFVLNVPMAFFEKKLFTPPPGGGRRRRGPSPKAARILSLLLTLLAAAVIIPVLVLIIVPQLAESVSGLGSTIMYACSLTVDWESLLASAVDFVRSGFGNVVSSTISATKSIVSAVSAVFVAAVFAIYVLLQKERLGLQCRKSLYALLPEQSAGKIVEICRLSHRVFSSFITGHCIEAVILGAMFFIVMTVLRMPYALLVGCLIAVTALIPIVGAFIGCAVGAFLLLMVSPMQALAFVVMFLVLQQVEGNLIYPHVVGSSVGLPSIWVLAAVSVGGSLMGVAGMLLFIPLTSVLYTLFREFVYKRLGEKGLKVR